MVSALDGKWPQGVWDPEALKRGDLTLLLFAPKNLDAQTPHPQEELYIIIRGPGVFRFEVQEINFKPGDVLFVPCGKGHRFTRFSQDQAARVDFGGPGR
ncbi:MAG TPA: cupin domain-containing protein [Candidatus Acidoferrales bacterium]|nr:cupin domain-containing protein [Candidatus Acidoferrales bacterium]